RLRAGTQTRDRTGNHLFRVACAAGHWWTLMRYGGHMREVGIRELRASLTRTLRDVSRGERVRVTLRGRPVADIVPAGSAAADDRLGALVAEGRVTPAF